MTGSLACKYQLVPSVPPSEDRFPPTSYFPAIPIRLGADWSQVVYARIDVGAPTSTIDISLSHYLLSTGFGPHGVTRKADMTVLRPDHSPWILVDSVIFQVSEHAAFEQRPHAVTLGYESFLAALKISFDFPKRTFTITAPKRLLLPRIKKSLVHMPSSLLEAERLIKAGSYSSGVASLLTGIEEALSTPLHIPSSSSSSAELSSTVVSTTGDPAMGLLVSTITDLRNRAVHGREGDQPTKEEARAALKSSKKVIRALGRSS